MNSSTAISTLLFIIFKIGESNVSAMPILQSLNNFLHDNGHKYVDVFYNSSSMKWLRPLPKDIFLSTNHLSKAKEMDAESFGVFIFEDRVDNLETYLKIIAERKLGMSLLLDTNPLAAGTHHRVVQHLEKMRATSYFYVAVMAQASAAVHWYQILSLNSGVIADDLTFEGNSLKIGVSFDLKGLEVTSTSLSWYPFYTIDGCNNVGKECTPSYGYLVDYLDIIAKNFNFTYSEHRNVDNNWGLVPKDNGTYEGILGDIAAKKYDMTIGVWWWLSERDDIFDEVPIVGNRDVLAMKSGKSNTDFSLFTRVFTKDSWITIFFMIIALSAGILFVTPCTSNKHINRGKNLITYTLLLFFVLIRAYYGAALTKYFTVSVSEPFENKREVIKAYPRYNLMIRDGTESLYYFWMQTGDEEYVKFWRRYIENPEKYMYFSEEEGLELIDQNAENIIACDESMLLGYLKKNVMDTKPHLLAHGEWSYMVLLLQKNSPLTPVIKHGVEALREKGIEQQLRQKWIGAYVQDNTAMMDAIVLTPGQVILIFAMMMLIYGVTLVLFCGELAASKIRFTNVLQKFHDKTITFIRNEG